MLSFKMSYTRPCNKCGERISMRQMPAGQWLAFDVSTEEVHECGIKNEPDIAVKLKGRKKIEEKNQSVDLGYDDDDIDNQEDYIDDGPEVFTSKSTIKKIIDKSLKKKKRLHIKHIKEDNGEETEREISPQKLFKYKNSNYLQTYCHLRKAERSFKVKSIYEASMLEKKMFKPKRLKKPDFTRLERRSSTDDYDYSNNQTATYQPKQRESTVGSAFRISWEIIVFLFWVLVIGFWILGLFS